MSQGLRALSPVEGKFFEAFFDRLSASGIAAIILRNYDDFPAAVGHDLDVFFKRSELGRAVGVFREVLEQCGGEVLHIHGRDYFRAVWFRVTLDESEPLHLDFYHGAFTWHGLPYLSETELLAASRPFRQFKVPRPAHEALALFLTSLLWGGFFKVRYHPRIRALLGDQAEQEEFHRLFQRAVGRGAEPLFLLGSESVPSSAAVIRYVRRLRWRFKARSLCRQPVATAWRLGRHWLGECGTMLFPSGTTIVIMGPDGSGKSTVLQALKERIGCFFGSIAEYHWRPGVLPDLGGLFSLRGKSTGLVANPHGKAPHSRLISLISLLYYWLDYWLGYPGRVWRFKAQNCAVVFDRYADDMWCDSQRYRLRLPSRLLKLFCRLVPQPDQVFVLLAPPEVIQARKREVSPESLAAALRNYAEIAQLRRRARAIDCGRPVDKVADEIAAAVLARLKAKVPRHRYFRQ